MIKQSRLFSIFTLILFSLNIFSQEKFEDDLDSLFLKNGDLKIGKVSFDKKSIEYCRDKKNCVDYKFSEVDGFVNGLTKKQKEIRTEKNMVLKYEKRTVLQYQDERYGHAIHEYTGKKYDFYFKLATNMSGKIKRTYVRVLITNSNERIVIASYIRDKSPNKAVENATDLFKKALNKCKRLEDLNAKNNKELTEMRYNLNEIIDDCDLTVQTKSN